MDAIDEVTREFLNECYKNLDLMARDLSSLERQPTQLEPSTRFCRSLHTFKGTAGMLEFTRVQKMAQAGENLLMKIRDGKLAFQPKHVEALRSLSNSLEDALEMIQRGRTDEDLDWEPLTKELQAFALEGSKARKG
jgi:two-component system chemotaxis sensor kinase CheA